MHTSTSLCVEVFLIFNSDSRIISTLQFNHWIIFFIIVKFNSNNESQYLWNISSKKLPYTLKNLTPAQKIGVVTGKLGELFLKPIITQLNEVNGLFIDLIPVENDF